ncbi:MULTISPECIES: chemotaxis protein CheD [Alkalihalophilus]|uniref:Probable chemoreceptor glutamine deamidase CheD n=2 Tax=Alkalihalophilus pseudofirmus TaxID=79885 RepID=D3FT15_ALKPO|nr:MULTISPECIES: chemotaxis protein CheD [Alkalihalophilus]ADC48083.1 methylation of methyl-accepting chemotaxis protein [Alkalihalophilus pseudofirmus OF4]MDV2885252.1 chemotaxis protein CheD [Alkalihalophilus pseudofirmus]MEC2073128.1 chemotaxis protein CheD [Alkalihalophilus marmarensis]MED1602310.1 chemotaxis protein CheD [Alkalihalophilus marmarensis]WEG15599.1 chemotaxis protein CheD [Alkalihalophilus pseudofirmus]
MSEVIKVGMADLKLAAPPNTIRTSGLGSCVGVVIYDEMTNISGMAHVMLPDSSQSKQVTLNTAKYADTAIKELFNKMIAEGARSYSLKAKMAGGAQMFTFQSGSDVMRIGPRNVEAVKLALKQLRIPVLASDVGGKSGRTIEFDPVTKKLHIRTVNQGTVAI